jgi:hypothetical protein
MRPLKRFSVSKSRSSSKFRRNTRRTRAANVSPGVMRGGIRL